MQAGGPSVPCALLSGAIQPVRCSQLFRVCSPHSCLMKTSDAAQSRAPRRMHTVFCSSRLRRGIPRRRPAACPLAGTRAAPSLVRFDLAERQACFRLFT